MSYEDIRRQLRASVGEDKGEDARMRYARQDQQRRQQEQQQQQASAFDNYLKQLDDKVTSTTSAYEAYKNKLDSLPAFDDPYAGYAVDPVSVANMSTGGSKKTNDELGRLYKEMTEAKNAQQEARDYQNYTTKLKSFGGDSEAMFQDYADRIKNIESTYRTQPDKWREARKQVKTLEQERDALRDYEDRLKKGQESAAVLDAWAKGHGGNYESYQLAQQNYDELDRQVTQLQNELMVSGGAEQDYSGLATDEMTAAAITNRPAAKGNSKELQAQLEQAIREREQAKLILQYAQAHQADELNKAPDFELKAASGEEKFKAFKQEQAPLRESWEANAGYATDEMSAAAIGDYVPYDPRLYSDYREPDERWTEDEKKRFYYLFDNEKTRQQAYDYAIGIDQKYNRGEAEERDWQTREFATRSFGTGAMASALSVPANLIGGGFDYARMALENAARGGVYETQYDGWSRWADTTRGAIAEKLNESGTISKDVLVLGGNGLGDLYQLMMSMADSSVAVLAGGGAANAVFFGSAAASTTRDALERGISGNRAVAMGFAAGAAEVAGETLSVEHLLKQGDIADYLRHGLLREMAKQGGVEASEEVLTSILNMMADAVINGDESELQQKVYVNVANGMAYDEAVRQASKEWLEELGTDALGGFLSGGLMSGGRLALQSGVAAVTKYQGDAKGDLELARLTTEGSRSRSLADQYQQRLDKKGSITNLQAARLQAQTSADISAADRPALLRAAEERLRDQSTSRMTTGEYKRMAQDIVDGVLDGRTSRFSTALEQNVYEEMRMQIAGETVRTGNWLDDAGLKLTEARNAAAKRMKMVETKDGEKVEVKNATMKDGELQLTIEQDGETKPVDLKDLKLDQYQMRALKTLTDTLGDDAAAAYNMMSGTGLQYGRASSIASYATAFGIIRDTFGRSADTEKAEAAALASSLRKGLTDEQVRYAVAIGQKRAKENGTLITRDKSVWGTGKVTMDGGTLNDGTVLKGVKNKAKVLRSRQYAAVKAVAKALGIDVVLFESEADKDGNLAGAQGAYQDGVIYLDWNAGMNNIKATSERMLLRTMSHELTHFLQQNAPEDYEKLKNYVTAYLAEKMGENYRRLVMEKMANQPGLSYDGAIDEVVADSCETMLRDSQYVQEMIRKDRSFGQKIWDWIKSFFRRIEASDTGAKYMQATIDELRDIWDSAMKNAVESRPDVDTSSKKAAEGGEAQLSTRKEALAVKDVDWMDDFSSIKEQLEKHRAEIAEMSPIAEVTYAGEDRKELETLILEQLPKIGGSRMSKNGVSFDYDSEGAHVVVLHARSNELRAAALASPYVLKRGKLIAGQKNHENTNMTTLTFASPVIINGVRVNVGAVVQFTSNGRPRAVNVETESGGVFKIEETAQGLRSRTGKSQVLQLLTRAVSSDNNIAEESQKSKGKVQKSVRDYDKTVILKESTIDKYLKDYAASNPKYAQAYITYMDPSDFLSLTTVFDRQRIKDEAEGLTPEQAGEFSLEQPIQLMIDTETGKVVGHEGRHRMAAMLKAGIQNVPVLLFDSKNKYSKEPIDMLILHGQDFDDRLTYERKAFVRDVLPLSTGNREEIIQRFGTKSPIQKIGEKYSGKTVLQYSTRGEAQKWDGVEEQAAEHFGTTENFRTAGYILQDGRMLDFSGAHWLDGYDEKYIADWKKKNDIRQVDHEDVYEAFEAMDEANAPSDSSLTFINRGNIRIVPEVPGIELSANAEPTAAQYQQIRNFVRETVFDSRHYNSDRFTVDLAITRSKRAGALRYTGKVSPDRVVNDIKHYFQTGEIREQGLGAFYSMRSSAKTDLEILESFGNQQIMAERLQHEKEILQGSVNELQRLLRKRGKTIEGLRRQMRLTKTPELRMSDAKRMTRSLLQDYDSRADAERISREIKELGEFVLGTELGGEAYDRELERRIGSIAREVVSNAKAPVTEGTDVYREIARRIKGTKVSIDERTLGELGDFEAFRKRLFGRITIAKRRANTREGREGYASADQVYTELQSDYGETIFPNALDEGEQLLNIARVLELSTPQEANPFAEDMEAAEESVRGRILMDLYSGMLQFEAPTAADRAKSRREALQQQVKELQRQNKLSAKEAERLAETVYDLSLNLDQAQSRYRTLAEQSKKKLDELQKYRDLNDRYREKEREVSAALQELDRLVQHSGSREEIQRQRAKVSAKEEQMAKALERLTQARGGSEIQEILRQEREIQMQRTQDRIRDSIDRRDLRQRISKLWKDLNARVTNPSEKKRIPVELMQQTLDVLEALNMDTSRDGSKAGEKLREKLSSLRARYEELKNDPDFRRAAVYDAQVAEYLTNMIAQVGDTPINKMSVAQMETVLETLKAMVYTARRALKLKLGEQELEAYEVSKAMTRETRSVEKPKTGFLSTWLNAQLSPERMFNRLGGYSKDSYWNRVYGMLNEGQLKQTRLMMEGSLIFEDLMEGENEKNFRKLLDPKNTVDIGLKDENGEPVLITHGMMISLYMHLQNDQNIRHIAYGGLSIPALQDYYNGKKVRGSERATRVGGALQEIAEINDRLHETEDADEIAELEQERDEAALRAMDFVEGLREEIDKLLTDYDRQWIAASKELFDGFSKRELNKTTMDVYGIKRANVENYYPIWVDGDFLNTPFETVAKDLSLENAGFMKERIDSSKPIRLADVTDVTSSQIRKVAQYCGLMPSIRGFNKVWGKTQTGYRDSLQKAVHETFGQAGVKYVENLMADLNGARGGQDSALGEFLNRMRGHMAQASLTMSLRVAMGQTASYPTAAAVVGWGPLMKALAHGGRNNTIISRADQELIRKWSPLLYYRMKGYSTTELGDIAGMNDKFSRLWKKARWLTGWIQAMDGATVGRLWYAAEYYVQDNNKTLVKGTDAYYEAVAKVFNDIVEKTQPDYTTMQRPDILRNPNALVKQLTMFLTQRLQNFNILYDAAATYSKYKADFKAGRNGVTTEDVRQAGIATRRAVISQLAAAATITAFKFLADAILHSMNNYRDDDDKELKAESICREILDMFIDSMAGNVLGGGEIWDIVESKVFGKTYYGIEVSGLATVQDMVDAFSSTFDHVLKATKDDEYEYGREQILKDVDKLARNIITAAGIPYANAKKIAVGLFHHAQDIRNGAFLSYEAGVERSNAQQASRLYRAYTNGDGAKVKQILEEVPEDKQKDVYSAVRKLIREQQKSGELNVYEAMRQMKNYGGATDQIMAEFIKDLYEAGALPKADAEKYLQEYAGKTKEAAAKTVTNVDGKQASGVDFNDIDDMFKLGTMSAEEARKALVGYGIDKDTANMKVEYWSYQQKNPGTAMTTENRFETYWKNYKPIGMTPSMYDDFYVRWNAVQGTDKNNDGKADANSKKPERIAIIDSLPLSREQKDALFSMEWKTGLQDAPWNK